jgi:hypothetical protein
VQATLGIDDVARIDCVGHVPFDHLAAAGAATSGGAAIGNWYFVLTQGCQEVGARGDVDHPVKRLDAQFHAVSKKLISRSWI